jgi:16S rRNA (guanine527-N7)-methyltransferase
VSPPGDPGATEDRLTALLERARDHGFLGPGPVADQLAHAEAFLAPLEGRAGPVLDLGSGGGVPGLVIAARRPDLEVVLLDANAKRAALLATALEALGATGRCSVAVGRAEDLGRGPLRGRFDAVTARSFGRPATTAECGAPFLQVGGLLIVSEPPDGEGRWPADGVAAMGLVPGSALAGPPRLQVLEQRSPCPAELPRRDGVPAKRPLF